MTWAMYDALVEACERVGPTTRMRVLILRGAGGKAFVAGHRHRAVSELSRPRGRPRLRGAPRRVLDRLERVGKPTIAQVEGVAAGGGCAIALACDLRVATPESTFGVPIARTLGNCLSGATYRRLVDLDGIPAGLKELLFRAAC